MELPLALLEEWMRRYYFTTEIDIGSSGVQDFALGELRSLLGIEHERFDSLVLRDSETLGGLELRQAIASRWGGDPERVMATQGSSEANFLVMNALLGEGDEVVVTDPCYPQLYLIAQAKGCRLRQWPLRFERRFQPDMDDLRALVGPRTRMIVANFPHNPTGVTLSAAQQRELLALAEKVGAYVVWDNAFGDVTYGHPPLPDPTRLYERTILLGTLSKCYGAPGLRVGWMVAEREVLRRCVRLRDYISLHLSPLVEMVATQMIRQADTLLGLRRPQAESNRRIVAAWAGERPEQLEWVPPQGGVCGFPRLAGGFDVEELCRRLAVERKVMLVPGICFGHDRHVRLGFGGPTDQLQRGLAELGELLALCLQQDDPAGAVRQARP